MRPFQAALDTCLDSPFFRQPLSSRFALHGLHALDSLTPSESLYVGFLYVLFSFPTTGEISAGPKRRNLNVGA